MPARSASLLTGAHPVKTSGANIRVGQSVDQAAAERVGHLTRLPSLEIGIERGRDAGSCDSGYSCAYSNSISWKNATTPMAKEINPRLVFERLFGNKHRRASAQARRSRVRQSVLDLVAEQAADLKNRLGSTDQQKIDQYFTSVREIEQRISRAGQRRHSRRAARLRHARRRARRRARAHPPDVRPDGPRLPDRHDARSSPSCRPTKAATAPTAWSA